MSDDLNIKRLKAPNIKITARTPLSKALDADWTTKSTYRFVVPTQLWGLVHEALRVMKRDIYGDGADSCMVPKVYIQGGCQIVFARKKDMRETQLRHWRCLLRDYVCSYDDKSRAWTVEPRVFKEGSEVV